MIRQDYPHLLKLLAEMEFLKEAVKYDIAPVVSELNMDVLPCVKRLESELIIAEKGKDTVFIDCFASFSKKALSAGSESKEVAQSLVANFADLLKFYGEAKTVTFQEFMGFLEVFFGQFESVVSELEQMQLDEAKQRREELSTQTKEQKGILDSALGNLRAGAKVAIKSLLPI